MLDEVADLPPELTLLLQQLNGDMGGVNVGRAKCMCFDTKCICLLSAMYYACITFCEVVICITFAAPTFTLPMSLLKQF